MTITIPAKDQTPIIRALALTNESFASNITFKRPPEYIGPTRSGNHKYRFTLTVKDTNAPGSRRSHTGRRIAAACWHAHGTIIDNLFTLGAIRIQTALADMASPADNWQDLNIGSNYYPLMASDACNCEA